MATTTSDTVNTLWFLRRLDLFEGFSDTQIKQVAGLMRDRVCLGPGQLFGTSSLFGAATAKFLQIMALHPGLAAKVITLLARQLFELEQSVERVATETVDQRLAGLLLSLATRDRGSLRLNNLSQSDLARMIGASRESVSRAIGRWEREGAVASGQRSVEVRDETALQRIAQG